MLRSSGPMPDDALIHLRVPASLKARWVRESRAAGMRLTDWIIQRMEPDMTPIIYLALADDGLVLAHFLRDDDARSYCSARLACLVPYNINNRDGAPAPAVGSVYRA